MRTKYILVMVLSAAVLFTGCMKEDIDELRAQQAENAERIAKLEEWQASVNGQIETLKGLIEALESYDYVTGVMPVTENGVTIGYMITFIKSSPITIYHGEDGNSPIIAAKQDTDGKYYWTVDGEWLTYDGTPTGNKVPVTGASPKVAIGTDGYWYVSATGTPPGTGWTSTGVKAQGDSMFAGVDTTTSDDYVIITLNDGPPATTITLPKYKSIGMSFTQPGAFIAGQEYRVAYTSTGTTAPTDIRVTNVPNGWAVSVSKGTGEFVITPPADFSAAGVEFGKATIWLDEGNKIAAMYNLELLNRRIASNTYGAAYYDNGVTTGTVYIVNDGTPGSGRVYTPQYSSLLMWDDGNYDVAANNRTDGLYNMKVIADFINNSNGAYSWSNFPVFEMINAQNPANTAYTSGSVGIWYLPALDELEALRNNTGAVSQWSWSSTSESSTHAWTTINTVGQSNRDNNSSVWARAICRF